MKDISDTLEYKGKQYKIVFDFNVMQDLQEEYGTFNNWVEEAYGKKSGEPSVKALSFAIMSMVNNGIDEANEDRKPEEQEKYITARTANRMLTEFAKTKGLNNVIKQIDGLMSDSLQGGKKKKNE